MNRVSVIQEIIKKIDARTYLELGVQKGICFLKIKAQKKLGVDPEFLISRRKKIEYTIKNVCNIFNEYYEMTSDDFFKLKSDRLIQHSLDVVFIDGLHTYKQSLRDVNNSLKYLKKDGIIIMHDCNPSSELTARPADSFESFMSLNLPGCSGAWCGDVWKTIVHLRSSRKDLNVFVLDCDCGLGIITKGHPENLLKYFVDKIADLSYNDLEKNRTQMLNLKNQNYFKEFIMTLH